MGVDDGGGAEGPGVARNNGLAHERPRRRAPRNNGGVTQSAAYGRRGGHDGCLRHGAGALTGTGPSGGDVARLQTGVYLRALALS